MKIVGLVGPKRSGKDTAASALVEQRGFVRVGFADQVKELALRIDPFITDSRSSYSGWPLKDIIEVHGWEFAKTLPEVRRFLQALGTDGVRAIDDEFWIKAWRQRVDKLPVVQRYEMRELGRTLVTARPDVVVPDVRFHNEAARLPGAMLVRITRPGLDSTDTHVSETEQAGIRCDVELTNDGTPGELHAKVLAAYDEWVRS